MKIHLGAGTIYLQGYVNLDASPHCLASFADKEQLEVNMTTFESYYKHDFGSKPRICIADVKSELKKMPFNDGTFDEAVLIHVLEHIPHYEVSDVLKEIRRILKPGGKFIVGVPDLRETAKLLVESKTDKAEDWYIRLIHGTQRNEWSHHFCGYTKRTLEKLLSDHGFGEFKELDNINFYPAIHLSVTKLDLT